MPLPLCHPHSGTLPRLLRHDDYLSPDRVRDEAGGSQGAVALAAHSRAVARAGGLGVATFPASILDDDEARAVRLALRQDLVARGEGAQGLVGAQREAGAHDAEVVRAPERGAASRSNA